MPTRKLVVRVLGVVFVGFVIWQAFVVAPARNRERGLLTKEWNDRQREKSELIEQLQREIEDLRKRRN